jgi:single-strand DNA-binding protein
MNRKGQAREMSLDNQITLRGFVTAEPKFRQTTQTATPVAEIRVGSTPRRLNRETGEWQDAPTSYYTVKCWRRLAINAASSLSKGDMVVIRGRFYMNQWTDSQQRPRATLEIEADSLGHDLAYGWSHFLRGSRPQPGRAAGVNAGEAARQDTAAPGPDDDSDEYPPDGYQGESSEAGLVPGDERDPGQPGFSGDSVPAETATPAVSIAESEEFDGFDSADDLPGPAPMDELSLPEPEAVPV